jgi:hypothetical protein
MNEADLPELQHTYPIIYHFGQAFFIFEERAVPVPYDQVDRKKLCKRMGKP